MSNNDRGRWRRWYKLKRWYALRAKRLSAEPLCRMCQAQGQITAAAVVDHIKPHKGDADLFFSYANTQSLCKQHHDGAKQSEERRGYSTAIGRDGWPIDPNHPANAGAQ